MIDHALVWHMYSGIKSELHVVCKCGESNILYARPTYLVSPEIRSAGPSWSKVTSIQVPQVLFTNCIATYIPYQ